MPKFKITAYEEVYYRTEIEADDEDEAYEIFIEQLGDYHPTAYKHNFGMTSISEVKPTKKRGKKSDDKHIESSDSPIQEG